MFLLQAQEELCHLGTKEPAVIYKYVLNPREIDCDQIVQMPRGTKVLAAAVQGFTACDDYPHEPVLVIWAEVDPDQPLEERAFWLAFTGSQEPSGAEWNYVNTFQVQSLVIHVYTRGLVRERQPARGRQ